MKNLYGIVIKTDSYAGNFERQMCAFITGFVGECEVGDEYEDLDFGTKYFPNVINIPDDHGCHRPVSMLAGDEKFNVEMTHEEKCNSLVIYFASKPTDEQIEIVKKRAKLFPSVREADKKSWDKGCKLFTILDFMLVESSTKTSVQKL